MAGRDRVGFLGHRFRNRALLDEALTHSSYRETERTEARDFDRLEFLGDRVLGLVVADMLLARHPEADAGELAQRFNLLVRRDALVEVARAIGLGAQLYMAKSESDSGGRDKPGILADACEAVLGAIYLDAGLEAAADFIERHWGGRIDAGGEAAKDPKTRLQEWTQARDLGQPSYREVAREGPPHEPLFTVAVAVPSVGEAEGRGSSKRTAERHAAEGLLARISGGQRDDG